MTTSSSLSKTTIGTPEGMTSAVWEHGSDFHYVNEYPGSSPTPWGEEGLYYFSGRPALITLLERLRSLQEAECVWMPAYYCDQVVYPISARGFSCRYYDGSPQAGWAVPDEVLRPGDVLIANSFFGMDLLPPGTLRNLQGRGVILIEDHSQDPYGALAWASQADYCFASLRKTLPLPDGGVLWSPLGRDLPAPTTLIPEVSAERMAAMLAKRAYLRGEFSSKADFRRWYAASEQALDQAPVSGMSPYSRAFLASFDVEAWRQARARNHRVLCTQVDNPDLTVLYADRSDLAPMGAVILTPDTVGRNALRRLLISQGIYPAVLWPLIVDMPPGDSVLAQDFADRMLFLHCDGRYAEADMLEVARVLNTYHHGVLSPDEFWQAQRGTT